MDFIITNKTMITLNKSEADALYSTGINNDCPYKYFDSNRKVWWSIIGESGDLPYTLCQNCYHNDNFGEKDSSIKEQLVPLMLVNVLCNCDGKTMEDGFPINFGNGWKLGIYGIEPSIHIINTTYNIVDNKFLIDASFPFDNCKFILNFRVSTSYSINELNTKCEIIRDGRTFKTILLSGDKTDFDDNISICDSFDEDNFYKFIFNKSINVKFTVKFYSIDQPNKRNDELLFEFDVYPRHINEISIMPHDIEFNTDNSYNAVIYI